MALKLCCIRQRYVFAIMGFFANMISIMIQLSVDLTIPHMVNETVSTAPAIYDPHSCPNQDVPINQSDVLVPLVNKTKGIFDWDEPQQASILSSYSSAYFMTQFIGGFAADTKGGKRLLCISLLMSSIAMIVFPLTAKLIGSNGPFVLMFIAGLAGGVIMPALMSMMSKWVPKYELSFVTSIIFPGTLIGHVVASSIAHPLILLWGWEAIYYAFGLVGLLWVVVWILTCSNNPNDHPRISKSEKEYLNDNVLALIRTTKYDLDPLPWNAFLTCVPFWTCVIGYTGRHWAFTILTTQVPQFMRDVLHLDISGTALSYQPYLCMWVFALIFGFASYVLIIKKFCSIKCVRIVFTSIAVVGSSLCIILIAYSGCSSVLAIFFLFLGMALLGAYYSGVMVTTLDIIPNYAGCIFGVVDNIGINSVIIMPALNKLIVSEALLSQWKIYFWIICCVIIISLAIFIRFIKTEQVWWDDVRKNGYPIDWKRGLFTTKVLIGRNGETVLTPFKVDDLSSF